LIRARSIDYTISHISTAGSTDPGVGYYPPFRI